VADLKFWPSGIAVALCCGLAAACTAGAQPSQPPPVATSAITLSVVFPADVTINRVAATGGEQFVPETAQLTLTNNSSSAVVLQKPNDCQSHVWTVSDAAGNTIDDRAICPMIFMPVRQPIDAHGTFTATQTVSLSASKYVNDGHYTLNYTFWGIKSAAPFTTHINR